jgi:hypothetical protein
MSMKVVFILLCTMEYYFYAWKEQEYKHAGMFLLLSFLKRKIKWPWFYCKTKINKHKRFMVAITFTTMTFQNMTTIKSKVMMIISIQGSGILIKIWKINF